MNNKQYVALSMNTTSPYSYIASQTCTLIYGVSGSVTSFTINGTSQNIPENGIVIANLNGTDKVVIEYSGSCIVAYEVV